MTISIPTLHDSCMLVYPQVRVWSARKLDKKQTQKAIADANATDDAARVNKHLLANADDKLKAIQRKGGQIRDYVESKTLPWDNAGNRLLTNADSLTVVGELHKLTGEFYALVDEFVLAYPGMRAAALQNLGDMADDSDYPLPEVVRQKFSVVVSYNPLPTGFGDVRTGMSEQAARLWQKHFEGNVQTQVAEAVRAAYGRLRENLQRYSDNLQPRADDPEKMRVFRDTMVSSLRETCALLSSINIFGDAQLTALNAEVLAEIAHFEPDALRASPLTAVTVKSKVDDVLARMKEYLGE